MRNVIPYSENTFEFHKKVIKSKKNSQNDPSYKEIITSYNDDIERVFTQFEDKFSEDKLEELVALGYSGEDRETLHKLYNYKSNVLQNLKVTLTTTDMGRIINTCQNCTISEVNSFDHFLPKGEFAEYAVNPKNLFPSCTTCNSYKGTVWREGGVRVFLNLYLDELPEEQYLFIEVEIDNDDINITYEVDNRNGIESGLYDLIKAHYDKLYLCRRFKENSHEIVSKLDIEINGYKSELSLDKIKQVVLKQCSDVKQVFGFNYWETILISTLINNEDYMNRF